jgi:hypothetical protein
MIKYCIICCGFLIWFGCSNIPSNEQEKNENNKIYESPSSELTSIKHAELSGLWVNSDYIEKVRKTHSITKAETNFDFFISILFKENNTVEVLEIGEMEPSSGKLNSEKELILVYGETYTYAVISNNTIRITKDNKSSNFIKYSGQKGLTTFDGYHYLQSLLLLGDYKISGNDSLNNNIISFKANNEVKGYLDYNQYDPSSFLENDILLFSIKNKGDQPFKPFVLKASNSGFILEEVKDFDWFIEKYEYTGKKMVIEKIK